MPLVCAYLVLLYKLFKTQTKFLSIARQDEIQLLNAVPVAKSH